MMQTQLLHGMAQTISSVSLSTEGLTQNPCTPLDTVTMGSHSPPHLELLHFGTWFPMPAGAAHSCNTQVQPSDAAYHNIALFIMDYDYFFRVRWLLVVLGAIGIC